MQKIHPVPYPWLDKSFGARVRMCLITCMPSFPPSRAAWSSNLRMSAQNTVVHIPPFELEVCVRLCVRATARLTWGFQVQVISYPLRTGTEGCWPKRRLDCTCSQLCLHLEHNIKSHTWNWSIWMWHLYGLSSFTDVIISLTQHSYWPYLSSHPYGEPQVGPGTPNCNIQPIRLAHIHKTWINVAN